MSDIVKIEDYTNLHKPPYLVEVLRESNIQGILSSSAKQSNELETVFFQILLDIWLDTATGAQLDVVGVHLDLPRNGRIDEAYRVLLKAKVQINISSGEPERLILAVQSLFDVTDVTYLPVYPAKVLIYSETEDLSLLIFANLETESDDNMTTTGGDNIVVNVEDTETPKSLLNVVPAGVGLLLGPNWILNTGERVVLNTGEGVLLAFSIIL